MAVHATTATPIALPLVFPTSIAVSAIRGRNAWTPTAANVDCAGLRTARARVAALVAAGAAAASMAPRAPAPERAAAANR